MSMTDDRRSLWSVEDASVGDDYCKISRDLQVIWEILEDPDRVQNSSEERSAVKQQKGTAASNAGNNEEHSPFGTAKEEEKEEQGESLRPPIDTQKAKRLRKVEDVPRKRTRSGKERKVSPASTTQEEKAPKTPAPLKPSASSTEVSNPLASVDIESVIAKVLQRSRNSPLALPPNGMIPFKPPLSEEVLEAQSTMKKCLALPLLILQKHNLETLNKALGILIRCESYNKETEMVLQDIYDQFNPAINTYISAQPELVTVVEKLEKLKNLEVKLTADCTNYVDLGEQAKAKQKIIDGLEVELKQHQANLLLLNTRKGELVQVILEENAAVDQLTLEKPALESAQTDLSNKMKSTLTLWEKFNADVASLFPDV